MTATLIVRICSAVATSFLISAWPAYAQTFPAKPVRLVVGFSTGGGTDTLARIISRKLAESWPHSLVVENRPGADGSIATELASKAPADGYTLVMVSNAHTITPFQRKLGYDPIKDFAPVTQVAYIPNLLLVHPSLPVKSVQQLIALAKARPGELSFGSSGTGTTPYLAMELFKSMSGINMVHVPYKGSSPAVIDLVGGHIQLMFGAISTTYLHVKAGKVRALAVTSPQRWPTVPDLPTVAESGLPGFEAATWYGVLAPAGTPPEIVATLHNDMAAALNAPEVKSRVSGLGFAPVANRPEEFAAVIRSDMAKWGRLLRAVGGARP